MSSPHPSPADTASAVSTSPASDPGRPELKVALVGNPNSGKSTIFNALTGENQHVGNYPGVTVERKEGFYSKGGLRIRFIDLPGTYSLTAHSLDEKIARDYIVKENPNVVVDIVDYSNLERNLYLTVQLLELNVPLVLVFNMSDVAEQNGVRYDLDLLSHALKAPIVPAVGHRRQGIDLIIAAIQTVASRAEQPAPPRIFYGKDLEAHLTGIIAGLKLEILPAARMTLRWIAVALLENDPEISELVHDEAVKEKVQQSAAQLEKLLGDAPDLIIVERRYAFIAGLCRRAAQSTLQSRLTMSDRIDRVMTHPWLGLPIFFGLMYLLFTLTFAVGAEPMGWIESLFGWLSGTVSGWWQPGSDSPLRSLLVDGIIAGVGGVLVFLPVILFLFLGIALLEDSGYMPRAAFIMDNLMQRLGLQGKSFIPMLIGFGCSVPAIMATRSIDNRRDRLVTMLIIPLMSCGARLPIFTLVIAAFFPTRIQGTMLFLMYLIGIALAIGLTKLLRTTLFRGPSLPLIMELPPYRVPSLRSVSVHTWERALQYLRKAGTLILTVSVVLWALASYPKPNHPVPATDANLVHAEALEHSFAGRLGKAMEPAIKLMGFDWRAGTAMIGAFAAKEVFVAQMGVVFAVGEQGSESGPLQEALRRTYTPLTGFVIMLFMLVATPCVATFAVTKMESGSWRWAFLQFGGLTALGYVLCVVVYQVGRLMGM